MRDRERMTYEQFMAQSDMALALDTETALKDQQCRQALGERAVMMMFVRQGVNIQSMFWTEFRWKASADDTVAPFLLSSEDGTLLRGLALWDQPEETARVSSEDRLE